MLFFNFKSMKKPKFISIKYLYILTMLLILGIILFTPFLVKSISIIDESFAESILLLFLTTFAYFITFLYKKQSKFYKKLIVDLNYSKKNSEERLNDALKYIGKINVQVQEIESAFNIINKYPESKQEVKKLINYLAGKILGIINADWVVLRIIDTDKIKTLTEAYLYRNQEPKIKPNISNKALINKEALTDFTIVSSTEDNFTINTYCVFPAIINKEQEIFIESIANQVEMLYIIYSSVYLKKEKQNL